MNSTNADNFSLLASLVGFSIAIYAIVTQPVQVDSARPTGTRNESKVEAAEPAFARLWDDPFAVYPEENEARLLQPLPPGSGDTLYLIVPIKTEQYEEDRENRIRTRLRGAALAARAAVLDAYEREKTDAVRLIARLQSYGDAEQPWQDDESTLVEALKRLLRGAGTTPSNALREMAVRIKEPMFRFRLCGYLQSLIQRDQTFVKQLGEMRTGVLAPLLTNPVTAALMIPLGGAGGLSVIEWIVSNAR